jgi:hypothetical protein
MSGQTSTNQTQSQQSQTQPWAPAQPMLQNILSQLGNGNLAPTAGQTTAAGNIVSEVGGVPSFGGQGIGAVNNLFGSSTAPQQNTLTNAYGQVSGALSPMLNAGYTNPYTDPALSSAMSTMGSDITNQIKGEFAAAGRPAGTNADSSQAIARGLAQGEGGLLANEFNTLTANQMGAAGELTGAAGATAGGLTQQQQVPLQNEIQGISTAGAIPGLLTMPGAAQYGAANLQAGLPWQNLGQAEGLTVPIAGLGSQSSGTMTGTTSQQSPWYTTALGAGLGGLGLLGGTGAFGAGGWLGSMGGGSLGTSSTPYAMMGGAGPFAPQGYGGTGLLGSIGGWLGSDERIKDDIEPIGMLYDETPVYSFKYKGDETPRIGLMAQDVERRVPEAVREFGGVKMVDYGRATARARAIGMLGELDLAA